MGMSGSQARLLTLTARMHDVEYKAQNIMNQKVALATQKDDLYQNYCEKLDAKKIQVAYFDGVNKTYVDANFATVCKYNPSRCRQYALKDASSGKVIVDPNTYDMYNKMGFNNDKYSFAWAMLGMGEQGSWNSGDNDCASVGYGTSNSTDNGNLWLTDVEQIVFDNHKEESGIKGIYDHLVEVDEDPEATNIEKREALSDFRSALYNKYGSEIYNYMRLNKNDESNTELDGEYDSEFSEEFPKAEFDFYTHLFEEIQASGGCVSIDALCQDGDAGNDWFNNMVNSGRVLISEYIESGANKGWSETSVATSTNQNYLQEVSDEKDLKKAEAEYEYELGKINSKDAQYDKDLSKLETEENAMKTEIDSLKKVIDDNVQRNFGIFS